jgi:hypothetical protein
MLKRAAAAIAIWRPNLTPILNLNPGFGNFVAFLFMWVNSVFARPAGRSQSYKTIFSSLMKIANMPKEKAYIAWCNICG